MLVATTFVAVCLVGWRERTRYLREHLFVNVVDQVTGGLLPRFQYHTSTQVRTFSSSTSMRQKSYEVLRPVWGHNL